MGGLWFWNLLMPFQMLLARSDIFFLNGVRSLIIEVWRSDCDNVRENILRRDRLRHARWRFLRLWCHSRHQTRVVISSANGSRVSSLHADREFRKNICEYLRKHKVVWLFAAPLNLQSILAEESNHFDNLSFLLSLSLYFPLLPLDIKLSICSIKNIGLHATATLWAFLIFIIPIKSKISVGFREKRNLRSRGTDHLEGKRLKEDWVHARGCSYVSITGKSHGIME
jgi:hypothetical protein